MKRVNIFVEGQTEETFVREILYEHFQRLNIYLSPILIRTSKTGKGGVSTYGKIKVQITRKCLQDQNAYVTTMFDYYGLPGDFPGKKDLIKFNDPIEKAVHLENAFKTNVSHVNFIPNLIIHEFEALLYCGPNAFKEWFNVGIAEDLEEISKAFNTPEYINDNPQTAPSKRILKLCPNYNKVLHGTLIADEIGLDIMRKKCNHFSTWLNTLEALKDTI